MGRENKYFKVGGFRFLQALTPRECYSRFIVARPSGPLSRHGKGGGGKGQIRPWLPWERFCAQYGLIFGSTVNQSVSSTASDRGLGAAPQACFALGPPTGRKTRWGKEERRSVGGLPNAQAGRPDVKRSPRRRTRVKGTPRRRAVLTVTYW